VANQDFNHSEWSELLHLYRFASSAQGHILIRIAPLVYSPPHSSAVPIFTARVIAVPGILTKNQGDAPNTTIRLPA
jgi:hypothetical protein